MTAYYVATLARYVLVDANDEAEARERGRAALQKLSADGREGGDITIRTVRLATNDEIDLMRWHQDMANLAGLLDKPLEDWTAKDKTDWTPMSVPGRENADGTETPTTWFAYNRATRKSVRFGSFEEAAAFCFHPDNQW